MKIRYAILLASVAPLASCAPTTTNLLLTCDRLSGNVYVGVLNTGDDLTINFRDTAQPGFKHNVQVMPPPPAPTPVSLDGECGAGVVVSVYRTGISPSNGSKDATWNLSGSSTPGVAFHLADPGSTVFPQGAQGDFSKLQ
jgi:hypothetical protein